MNEKDLSYRLQQGYDFLIVEADSFSRDNPQRAELYALAQKAHQQFSTPSAQTYVDVSRAICRIVLSEITTSRKLLGNLESVSIDDPSSEEYDSLFQSQLKITKNKLARANATLPSQKSQELSDILTELTDQYDECCQAPLDYHNI